MKCLLKTTCPFLAFLLVDGALAFVPTPSATARTTPRSQIIDPKETASPLHSSVLPEERPLPQPPTTTDRRRALATLAFFGAANVGQIALVDLLVNGNDGSSSVDSKGNEAQSSSSKPTESYAISSPPLTLDDALDVIASSVDRRFLHAVVASDYRLMYRTVSQEERGERGQFDVPTVQSGESNLLLSPAPSADGPSNDFYAALDVEMKDRPVRPSNGLLAITDADAATRWEKGGEEAVASVWPLGEEVHYAWPETGNEFWSRGMGRQDAQVANYIVDGIDCGRMSLEDALERERGEIMFRCELFLAVPVSMERMLVEGLRNSFII